MFYHPHILFAFKPFPSFAALQCIIYLVYLGKPICP